MSSTHHPLGIDIGGSGIKGAPVDLDKGVFAEERLRLETPSRVHPEAVAAVVKEIAEHFADDTGDSPIGVTFPAVVTHGVVRTAANIDQAWIGTDAEKMLSDELGRAVVVVNDADAAGVGELHYGAARDHEGLVLVTTLGTGIGTALINRGALRAQHRAGPPRDRRSRRRDPGRLERPRDRGPVLGAVGQAAAVVLLPHREPVLARPLRGRWRGVQEGRQVPAAAGPAHPDRAGQLQNSAGIIGAAWLAVDRARD